MYWYTRDAGDRDAAEAAELLAVKQREEDLMAEVQGPDGRRALHACRWMHANGMHRYSTGGDCTGAQSGSLRYQIS